MQLHREPATPAQSSSQSSGDASESFHLLLAIAITRCPRLLQLRPLDGHPHRSIGRLIHTCASAAEHCIAPAGPARFTALRSRQMEVLRDTSRSLAGVPTPCSHLSLLRCLCLLTFSLPAAGVHGGRPSPMGAPSPATRSFAKGAAQPALWFFSRANQLGGTASGASAPTPVSAKLCSPPQVEGLRQGGSGSRCTAGASLQAGRLAGPFPTSTATELPLQRRARCPFPSPPWSCWVPATVCYTACKQATHLNNLKLLRSTSTWLGIRGACRVLGDGRMQGCRRGAGACRRGWLVAPLHLLSLRPAAAQARGRGSDYPPACCRSECRLQRQSPSPSRRQTWTPGRSGGSSHSGLHAQRQAPVRLLGGTVAFTCATRV